MVGFGVYHTLGKKMVGYEWPAYNIICSNTSYLFRGVMFFW